MERKAIHFNGSDENIELLLRTVISANLRSVYGDTTEIPTVRFIAETHANAQQRKTLSQEYEREFEQLSEDQKLFILCSEAGLKLVEKGQYSKTLDPENRKRDATFLQRMHNG